MDWARIVGANIKRFRLECGLSQEAAAHSAGINLRYFGGVERGEENPSISVICRIADAIDTHPADLFDEEALDVLDD